ncbi:uncharacterized protein LOC62_07G009446 [Vanrija pseudolonga]|uniref:Uncharacterized protein n=1 Tax=Vanrija pseudolonga TaxID=143232 RepID=A0AAF0YGH5_9TREE|nr:hypothetical protein LOC62_07G009446 [Vanrija pseudolonga]
MPTPSHTSTCPIRRILKGEFTDDNELLTLCTGLTVAQVKVGVTEYLADMASHVPPAHLLEMFAAREKTLKTVLAILGNGAVGTEVTEEEAEGRKNAALTAICCASKVCKMVPEAHDEVQDIFTATVSETSLLNLANGANVLIYNLCVGVISHATAGCREITELLGQYCANNDTNAVGIYVAGLSKTFTTIRDYRVAEVTMFRLKMETVFKDVVSTNVIQNHNKMMFTAEMARLGPMAKELGVALDDQLS